jgi:hypothetical protein
MQSTRRLVAALIACAVIAALPATHEAAAAVLPPTTVSPAGDYVSLTLPPGAKVHERVSGTDTVCTSAASRPKLPLGTNAKNRIPTTNNPSTGAVTIPIRKLSIGNCTTSAPLVLVDVDNTSGWQLVLRHKDNTDVASLVIPKNGSIVSVFIGAASVFCQATAAPDGPVVVKGKWKNGNPSTFTLTDAQIPAEATGNLPCPQGSVTASITATFHVTNASHPGTPVTVS